MPNQNPVGTPYHEQLRQLDPYVFEQFIADLWSLQGWDTEVSQQSSDRGVDIVATKVQPIEQKHVLQAKRYDEGNKVGSQAIQQYSSLRQQEPGTDTVVIVTTSGFTKQARELANRLNVKVVNGEELSRLIDQLDAGTLVSDYTGQSLESPQQISTVNSPNTASEQIPETETRNEDMAIDEAIIAVIRLLLIIGVLGYTAFYLLMHFVL